MRYGFGNSTTRKNAIKSKKNKSNYKGFNNKNCSSCKEETLHTGNRCMNCNAIKKGYKSYSHQVISSKCNYLKKYYKISKIEDLNKLLNNKKIHKRKLNNLFKLCTLIGKENFYNNNLPEINKIDKDSNSCVYGIKLIKGSIVYIGETLNFDKRSQEHVEGLKILGNYPLTGKYITPEMNYNEDYLFIKLATPESNLSIFEKNIWLSCVESYFIDKYKTYELGNNRTGSWI